MSMIQDWSRGAQLYAPTLWSMQLRTAILLILMRKGLISSPPHHCIFDSVQEFITLRQILAEVDNQAQAY
jgi:hypothetical protein